MGYSGKDLLQLLKEHGRELDHVKGSHYVLRKGEKKIVVPIHGNKDLPKGTYFAIVKQAGISDLL